MNDPLHPSDRPLRRFKTGKHIVWRSVWRSDGVVGTAWPAVVVEDSDDLIALYRPSGTPGKQRSGDFIGRREPPHDGNRDDWRPDQGWDVPVLPATWRTEPIAE